MTNFPRRTLVRLGLAALAGLPFLAGGTRRAQAATHQVQIRGFTFRPKALRVAVGDTVVFTNLDSAPHTATADDGSFDTGRIRRGAHGPITFTSRGTHRYHCRFHPNMKGAITAA